jgi:hypothetical protein
MGIYILVNGLQLILVLLTLFVCPSLQLFHNFNPHIHGWFNFPNDLPLGLQLFVMVLIF